MMKKILTTICVPTLLAGGLVLSPQSSASSQSASHPERLEMDRVQGGQMSCKTAFALAFFGLLSAETGAGAVMAGIGISGMLDNC